MIFGIAICEYCIQNNNEGLESYMESKDIMEGFMQEPPVFQVCMITGADRAEHACACNS